MRSSSSIFSDAMDPSVRIVMPFDSSVFLTKSLVASVTAWGLMKTKACGEAACVRPGVGWEAALKDL